MNEAGYSELQLGLFDPCECPQGGYIHDLLFGKTSQERSQATKEWTSVLFWRNIQSPKFQYLNLESGPQPEWLEADDAMLHGEPLMLNIGESPSVAQESSLSQILQKPEDVPQKYYLSPKACIGILRRAKQRGKELPMQLKKALEAQGGGVFTTSEYPVTEQ